MGCCVITADTPIFSSQRFELACTFCSLCVLLRADRALTKFTDEVPFCHPERSTPQYRNSDTSAGASYIAISSNPIVWSNYFTRKAPLTKPMRKSRWTVFHLTTQPCCLTDRQKLTDRKTAQRSTGRWSHVAFRYYPGNNERLHHQLAWILYCLLLISLAASVYCPERQMESHWTWRVKHLWQSRDLRDTHEERKASTEQQ